MEEGAEQSVRGGVFAQTCFQMNGSNKLNLEERIKVTVFLCYYHIISSHTSTSVGIDAINIYTGPPTVLQIV